jgi:hypothetical protein
MLRQFRHVLLSLSSSLVCFSTLVFRLSGAREHERELAQLIGRLLRARRPGRWQQTSASITRLRPTD